MGELTTIENITRATQRDQQSLQSTLWRKVPVLVVAKPNQSLQPAVEACGQLLQLLCSGQLEERGRVCMRAVNVFEDRSIVSIENVDTESRCLLSNATRNVPLKDRVSPVSGEEVADPRQPEDPRCG